MKLYYSRLQIELTRRCNQACLHCCRGDAQDVDITKEIIDAFFQKNDISHIGTLLFSGGEPTLNGKMLEYFVDKIIDSGILVDRFLFGINGLSYSEELVRGLNKLREYILLKREYETDYAGFLMISQDQFHKEADKDVIAKLSHLPYLSPVIRCDMEKENILPYGRAYENGLSNQEPDLNELINYQKNYKIKEYEGVTYLVISYQYISANGNVVNDGVQSFDLMDDCALGNVQSKSIEEIYLGVPPKKLRIN